MCHVPGALWVQLPPPKKEKKKRKEKSAALAPTTPASADPQTVWRKHEGTSSHTTGCDVLPVHPVRQNYYDLLWIFMIIIVIITVL